MYSNTRKSKKYWNKKHVKQQKIKDRTKYDTFYSHSKAQTVINENDSDGVFKSIYTTVVSNIQKSLGKNSNWIIYLAIDHNINTSKYNLLAGSDYIKLPK